MTQLRSVDIPSPTGFLEGLLRLPDEPAGPVAMVAVVCHPHPQFGGTMHTKAVFRVAQALVDLGIPTLRFNFRGVGRSTGMYDEGRGEQDDIRAALEYLAESYTSVPICLGGFSFGAWVGLPVGCADSRVTQLIGAGVPLSLLSPESLSGCAKHKLIVQGDQDQYGPKPALLAWYATLPEPKALTLIADADHFFTHQQTEFAGAITSYFRAGHSALGKSV